MKTKIHRKKKSVMRFPAIYAAAPGMRKSSKRCKTRPRCFATNELVSNDVVQTVQSLRSVQAVQNVETPSGLESEPPNLINALNGLNYLNGLNEEFRGVKPCPN